MAAIPFDLVSDMRGRNSMPLILMKGKLRSTYAKYGKEPMLHP